MPKYLGAFTTMCLGVGVPLAVLFLSCGLPVDMAEVTLLSLWAIGSVAGVFINRGKGLRSILWGAAGGLAGVAAFVVFSLLGEGLHWYLVLLLTGLSIAGSLVVGCVMALMMNGIAMSRTRA